MGILLVWYVFHGFPRVFHGFAMFFPGVSRRISTSKRRSLRALSSAQRRALRRSLVEGATRASSVAGVKNRA